MVVERSSGRSLYEVTIAPYTTLLDALLFIKEEVDSSLAFRRSCESGVCGSCAVNINGRNGLACETILWNQKKKVVVAPLPAFEVLSDLVVDLTPFYSGLQDIMDNVAVAPLQSITDRKKLDGFYECIHCGACTSSCPIYWRDQTYRGPAVLLVGWRDLVDSRKENKKELLNKLIQNGIWECGLFMNCITACSKELNPAKAIVNIRNSTKRGTV